MSQIKRSKYRGILGVNITRNADTANEDAVKDYLTCLEKLYPHVSYLTVNVSCPNSVGLNALQNKTALKSLLTALKKRQVELLGETSRYVPLVVKISPDLGDKALEELMAVLLACHIDGVTVANTTTQRPSVVASNTHAEERGGLSGEPLSALSVPLLKKVSSLSEGRIAIIGTGGTMTAQDALDKFSAGADLVQVYTGLVYHGPQLIHDISNALAE